MSRLCKKGLFLRRSAIISDEMRGKIEERIFQIEQEIGNDIAEKYLKEIFETLKAFGGDDKNLSGSGRKKLWEFLKRKYPKCLPANAAGKKERSVNLITNYEGLKRLYLETYVYRLRNGARTKVRMDKG